MCKRIRALIDLKFLLLVVAIGAMIPTAHAGKMENQIQEAIYMFEMKGEISEATRILEKVANQGDSEDKEEAYFYLGKIQELSNNKTSSNFYYKQSLSRTNKTSKSYWLAERDAATGSQTESFLQASIPIGNRIQKVFEGNPAYCLLQNGSIGKIEGNRVTTVPANVPQNAQVLHITNRGFWYQPEDVDSLIFLQFYASTPRYSYQIPKITDFHFQKDHAIIQTGRQLFIINKKGIQASISEKYNGCTIENYFKPTNEYILNCPDNALHFIAAENGNEERIIAQFDVIQKTLIIKDKLYLVSNGFLYHYLPKKSVNPIWKISANNVESLFGFENYVALLEASGKISLIEQETGFTHASAKSSATSMYPLANGTIGLFSEEGSITAVDTLLYPLWHFNFTEPIAQAPIQSGDDTYLYFGKNRLQQILPRYYGKRKLRSEVYASRAAELCEHESWDELLPILDTLFKLEPGNAEGWFFKAIYLEKHNGNEKERQKAWSEAVRLSSNSPRTTSIILNRYAKSIGAKYVNLLPMSPKTRYPQLFGNKKDLFSIDPAADRLFCINPETGELRWSRNIGKLENSPVVYNDEKNLVIASGYKVNFFDLNKESFKTTLQLPGKAFEVKGLDNATYVSTWNGFLQKISKTDNKPLWSKKIYSIPFFIVKSNNQLYTCNLEGEFSIIDEATGQIVEGSNRKIQGPVSHMVRVDSTVAIATTNNKLFIFKPSQKDHPISQILMETSITSLQEVHQEVDSRLLIGLADQSVLLYSKEGAPLWKYKGKQSIFTNPFVKDNEAWLDQGNEIISISLKDGSVVRTFGTPGGAGTPYVMNHTLYSISPKKLLYGFSL